MSQQPKQMDEAQLVSDLIKAHGGLANWQKYNRLVVTLSFSGMAFKMKFNSIGQKPRRYIVSLDQPMVVIESYPDHRQQGIFTPDVVWIENHLGAKLKERYEPRNQLRKFPHLFFWDDLDLLYFAGYACWNYFNMPFLFGNKDFLFRAMEDWSENNKIFKRIQIEYPSYLPTHCRKQTVYLDKALRIYRFDYNPEVFASWARAAHYCANYQCFNGIWIPTERKVVARNSAGHTSSWPELVRICVKEIHFQ